MHSFMKRGMAVTFYYVSVLTILGFSSWAIDNYKNIYNGFPEPQISYKLHLSKNAEIQFQPFKDYGAGEMASLVKNLRFNLIADLRPLFTWNVKQVFVYVSIVPENRTHDEIIIWDKIIQKAESADLRIFKARPKYRINDYQDVLKANHFRLVLKWNVMSRCGFLNFENRNVLSSHSIQID